MTKRFLISDKSGVALIEFAIVFPLLMMLVFGCVELSRYLLINLKVQSASYAMANIVTQYPPATKAHDPGEISYDQLTNALGGTQLVHMLAPFGNDLASEGMIVTSVVKDSVARPGTPNTVIKWQIFTGGTIGGVNSIVNQKSSASISDTASFVKDRPTTFDTARNAGVSNADLATMDDGENMIVVEIFYHYEPLYTQVFSAINGSFSAFTFPGLTSQTITRQVMMRPRTGPLICLPGAGTAFLYPSCS